MFLPTRLTTLCERGAGGTNFCHSSPGNQFTISELRTHNGIVFLPIHSQFIAKVEQETMIFRVVVFGHRMQCRRTMERMSDNSLVPSDSHCFVVLAWCVFLAVDKLLSNSPGIVPLFCPECRLCLVRPSIFVTVTARTR